jgi:internalin A
MNGTRFTGNKWLKKNRRRKKTVNQKKSEPTIKRDLSPIRINLWDFGGQEIMHSTHQFFLTERSLYLLVLDARSGEHEGNLHGWLKTIQGFGGSSPVLVVVNKCEPPHQLQLDENRLKLDYAPNLRGIHYVSCESKQGMRKLRETIEQQILDLPHVNDELPGTYFDVKSELERRAQSEDFITQDRFEVVCQKNHIHDDESQRVLLQFLHDLGSVLHYDDPRQHYLVYDTNVLNPEWVTNGVYKILMNHTLRLNGDGKVRISDLEKLLGDAVRYPKERHRFLVDLMRKFDMCFEFSEDSGQLLVPELLSPNEPDIGWDIGDLLNFQLHYSVLPRGLMPRFIVRTHHLLTKNRTYWRSGVVLSIEGCRVAVRGDSRASIVYIQVQGGNPASRRRALAIVRDHFSVIHSSMPRLEVNAKVPLPGESKAPPVDFAYLCRLEEMGQDLYWFEGSDKQWSIRQLLDGTIEREYDVFLCYNNLDKPKAKMLSGILRERGIRPWLDEVDLTPGEPWQSEIAKAISACRTVVVLMGESGSGNWQIEEVRLALRDASIRKKRIIPVVLPGMNRSGADFPPEFNYLDERTRVTFEKDFDEENIQKLCRGING